jgi:hypothetical protein
MLRAAPLVLVLLLCCVGVSQTGGKAISRADLDKFLAQGGPDKLAQCTARVQEWQDFYDSYKPFCEQLKMENATLRHDIPETRMRIFIGFGAVGFGAFMAFLVSRGVRRVWPLSFEHKQLAVLVMVAAWVSVAALVAVGNSRFWYHPVSSAFGVGVWSLPALVFGAVAFWWFGKKHPRRLF